MRKTNFPAVISAGYSIGDAKPKGYTSFHVGNSLTDTFQVFLQVTAQSAGYDHKAIFHTFMGTPTDSMWNVPAMSWAAATTTSSSTAAPSTSSPRSPFYALSESIDREVEYTGKFYTLYGKPARTSRSISTSNGPSRDFSGDGWAMLTLDFMRAPAAKHHLRPATTWEEAIANHLAYFEAVRDQLQARFPDRPIYIIPTGEALANLKNAVESRRNPRRGEGFLLRCHVRGEKRPGPGPGRPPHHPGPLLRLAGALLHLLPGIRGEGEAAAKHDHPHPGTGRRL